MIGDDDHGVGPWCGHDFSFQSGRPDDSEEDEEEEIVLSDIEDLPDDSDEGADQPGDLIDDDDIAVGEDILDVGGSVTRRSTVGGGGGKPRGRVGARGSNSGTTSLNDGVIDGLPRRRG